MKTVSTYPPEGLFTKSAETVARRMSRTLVHLGEIEEDDDRWIADWGVVAGECEAAGLAIHLEDGDVVAALIAAIEELASGVEVETA